MLWNPTTSTLFKDKPLKLEISPTLLVPVLVSLPKKNSLARLRAIALPLLGVSVFSHHDLKHSRSFRVDRDWVSCWLPANFCQFWKRPGSVRRTRVAAGNKGNTPGLCVCACVASFLAPSQ